MPSLSIPFLREEDILVAGGGEQLKIWIDAPFSPRIAERIGEETVARGGNNRIVLHGKRYGTRHAWTQGMRYLILGGEGNPVAALNVTVRKEPGQRPVAIASNIYVTPGSRRQGLAGQLVEEALHDHPGLRLDGSLTEDGAALFGLGRGKRKASP